ncbi:MAG: Phospholipase D/Transphosphatidylase [candidate division TM6 bacterium GW2011_GWE2_41_16]|nr:MAG: Phospholipase D/Transphosphatidylase [candidate division TM6 bacterium GW2011_GWE2_41_16]
MKSTYKLLLAQISIIVCLCAITLPLAAPGVKAPKIEAYFAPDDPIKDILVDLIAHEQKGLKIASYRLTERAYAQEIIKAFKRGVAVEIVSDYGCIEGAHTQIKNICRAQIPVYFYPCLCPLCDEGKNPPILHDKFIIFESNKDDEPMLWTGSLNFTYSAHAKNQENCLLIKDTRIIKKYLQQFEILKERSERVSGNS